MKNLYNILIIAAILIVVFGCSCKGKEQAGVVDTSIQVVDSIATIQLDSVNQPKADTVYLPGKEVIVRDTFNKVDTLQAPKVKIGNSIPDCPNPPLCKVDTLGGYYERRTNLANGD